MSAAEALNAEALLAQAAEFREEARKFLALAADRPPEGPDAYAVARKRGGTWAAHAGPLVPRTTRVNPALDFVSVLSKTEAKRIADHLGDDFKVVHYDNLAQMNADHLAGLAERLERLVEDS